MNADAPLVSVLMPVRNEQEHVAEAISSVLRQSHKRLELLVVDGESSDRTVEIVRRLAADEPRLRLLANPDRSIPHALNVGLAAAAGDFVSRVDAHARVNDAYVERALDVLLAQPDVAAVGGRRIGVATGGTGRAVAAALSSPFGVGDSINHYATSLQDTDHASFGVYRRSVLQHVGGWDERLPANEDVDIDHRILDDGHRIVFDPDMHIYWQVRETLADFARQYRRYGRGKAAMLRKNGLLAARPRHAAAPALVVLLAAAAGSLLRGRAAVGGALLLPYAAAVTAATVHTRRSTTPPPPTSALAGAFVAMHTAWGVGMWEGMLLRRTAALGSLRDRSANR